VYQRLHASAVGNFDPHGNRDGDAHIDGDTATADGHRHSDEHAGQRRAFSNSDTNADANSNARRANRDIHADAHAHGDRDGDEHTRNRRIARLHRAGHL
jgi:hypothetical protein